MTTSAALVLLLAGSSFPGVSGLEAQDSHYWSQQYGTRAVLLGGAMIGGIGDLSAAYYNPGAIVLGGDQGLVLSGRAHGFSKITLDEGGGPGRDLDTSSSKPLPTMLAVPLRLGFLGRSRLTYTLLTRNQFQADIATSQIARRDVLSDPGDEELASTFEADANIDELWAGLAWSLPIGDRVGVGLTQFFSARDQTIGSELLAQAATTGGDVAIATQLRRRSYTSYRALWKLGAAADLGALTLGASLTTPSLGVGGSGTSIYNSSVAGLDLDGDGVDDPALASAIQEDAPAAFESSWAIGGGASYGVGGSRVHVSAEWFAAQSPFIALDADAFLGQTSGQPIDMDLTGEFSSVVNWAVGFERRVGDGSAFYASFARDHSASASDLLTDMVLTEYDLSRIGAGGSFDLRGNEVLIGISWARGSDVFPRLVDFDDLLDQGEILERDEQTPVHYRQWTVVFGFQLGGSGD